MKPNYRVTDAIHDRVAHRLKQQPPDTFLRVCEDCQSKWDARMWTRCPVCRTRSNGTGK